MYVFSYSMKKENTQHIMYGHTCALPSIVTKTTGSQYKRTKPRRFFLAAIEKQLPVGVRNVRAKHFPVNSKCRSIHTKAVNSSKNELQS